MKFLLTFAVIFGFTFAVTAFAETSPTNIPDGDATPTNFPSGITSPTNIPTTDNNGSVGLTNPLKSPTLLDFFQEVLNVIMIFAVPLIVFFIILAGFKYVMAQGNPTKITEASKALMYAIIGGVLILGAQVILSVISGTISAF